jgi:putative transposase
MVRLKAHPTGAKVLLTLVGHPQGMSDYRRPRIPGATIFFTVALQARGADTLITQAEALRVAVRRTRAERPFHIDAAVILPDHLHMIWTLPPGDSDYPNRWRVIKARFSQAVQDEGHPRASHLLRRERGLWQRRYWEHHIRSPEELAALTRYCWINPVKHGLAKDPFEWRQSSIHRDGNSGMALDLPDQM